MNKNNFIRFNGAETAPAFSILGVNIGYDLFANVEYVDTYPLSASSASLGIDNRTFRVGNILDSFGNDILLTQALEWDYVTGKLRVFRPLDLSVTLIQISFFFEDYGGNVSNIAYDYIAVSAVTVAWVAYPASASCSLDIFGANNGFLQWAQLKLINSVSMADIIPLTLKDNSTADPDYVAPVIDLGTCPTPSSVYAPLRISNFSKNGANPPIDFIVITQVTIACTVCGGGGSPLLINIPCIINPGETQSFSIPAITWDTGLTITYEVNPGGTMVGLPQTILWKSQSLGVVDDFPTGGPAPVTDAGVYGNFTISINPIFGTTIFCS